MKNYSRIITVAIVGLLFVSTTLAQEKKPNETPLSIEAQALEQAYSGTLSKNSTVQRYAFQTLSRQDGLLKLFGEQRLKRCIRQALKSEGQNLSSFGFEMLDRSSLPRESKQDLLVEAVTSNQPRAREKAMDRLAAERDSLLPRLIKKIESDPAKIYPNETRVIEQWGTAAKGAVPALIKNFEALRDEAFAVEIKSQEKKFQRDQESKAKRSRKPIPKQEFEANMKLVKRSARFEFLNIVFALAEIGPDAKPAMPVAIAAADVTGNRRHKQQHTSEEYQMAGMMCIEKMLSQPVSPGSATKVKDKKQSRGHAMGGIIGGGGSGAMISMMGGGGSTGGYSRGRSVRSVIERHLAAQAKKQKPKLILQSIDRRVDLIFQNHDIVSQPDLLTIEEVRTIQPPILLKEVDTSADKMVSKAELRAYLIEHSK